MSAPAAPAASAEMNAAVEKASQVPLPIKNYACLLATQRKRLVEEVIPEGDAASIERGLAKLLRLFVRMPMGRQASGALTRWAFVCHVLCAVLLCVLHHRLRDHRCHFLLRQFVQQLSAPVLKAVAKQLQRPEVQKTLSDRGCPVDLELLTLVSVNLVASSDGEFQLDDHLPLMQSVQPDLQPRQVIEIILQSPHATRGVVYKVLRHFGLKSQDAWTEEWEAFGVSCVCTFGYKMLDGPAATTLLFLAAGRQSWLKAACLLLLAASGNYKLFQRAIDCYEGSQQLLREVLPRLPQLYSDIRVVLILHEVLRIARLIHEHLQRSELYEPFAADPPLEAEPATPNWLARPQAAMVPGPSHRVLQRTALKEQKVQHTKWNALGVPDHMIFEYVSGRWPLLKPHQQIDLLHTMADYIVVGFSAYEHHEILQLELAALQVLIHLGPDCLNAAQQLELLMICTDLPALQARYAAAWVRLSPQRRLLLPKLQQMLPLCRETRLQVEHLLDLLPAATVTALDAFLQHVHSAVPESVFRAVNHERDGVEALLEPQVRTLAWRVARGPQKHKVHRFVAAIVEEPDVPGLNTRSEFLMKMDHTSVLQAAFQLLDDEALLEETKKCLPLLEEDEDVRSLLSNLAFRASDLLQNESDSELPSEAFRLLLEHSRCFSQNPVHHLELLVLACEDVFKQAQLLTLWTSLSPSSSMDKELAKRFWVATAKFQTTASDLFDDYVESIASLVAPEDLITFEECLEAYPQYLDSTFEAAAFRIATRDIIWTRNPDECVYKLKVHEGHPEEEEESAPEALQEDEPPLASGPPSHEVPQVAETTPVKKQTVPDAANLVPVKRPSSSANSSCKVPIKPCFVLLDRLPEGSYPSEQTTSKKRKVDDSTPKKHKISILEKEVAPQKPKQAERRSKRIAEKRKQVKADVPAPKPAPKVAKVPAAAEPKQKANVKRKQSPAKASTPAAKKPKTSSKVASAPQVAEPAPAPQPVQRPKRRAAENAEKFIEHCVKNLQLNKRAVPWETFEEKKQFLPACVFVFTEPNKRRRLAPE